MTQPPPSTVVDPDQMVVCIDRGNRIVHVGKVQKLRAHFAGTADPAGTSAAGTTQVQADTSAPPPVDYDFYLMDGRALTPTADPPGFEVAGRGSITPSELDHRIRESIAALEVRLDTLPAEDPDSPRNPRHDLRLPDLGPTLHTAVDALDADLGIDEDPRAEFHGSRFHDACHRMFGIPFTQPLPGEH